MNEKKYLTVVFEYEQGAAYPEMLTKAFAVDGQFKGVTITAISLEDEILRCEKLEADLSESESY